MTPLHHILLRIGLALIIAGAAWKLPYSEQGLFAIAALAVYVLAVSVAVCITDTIMKPAHHIPARVPRIIASTDIARERIGYRLLSADGARVSRLYLSQDDALAAHDSHAVEWE